MQNTEIATPARRITRTLNAAPVDMVVAFDADGREVGRTLRGVQAHTHGAYLLPARNVGEDRVPARWTYAAVTEVMAGQDADR